MSFLFDTNVVSETRKRRPPPQILAVLNAIPLSAAYVSVLTLGEMRRGAIMKAAKDLSSAEEFDRWILDIENTLGDRILSVNMAIAQRWGEMSVGRTRPTVDTMLAATASVHGLTVVTRNVRDFQDLGLPILNPWDA